LDGNTTGNFNTALGYNAGPSSSNPGFSNTTAIGYLAMPTTPGQVRIGNTSVSSIGGQVSWSTLSDGRFKRDIREDVSGLEFINKLRP
jgi:trimeric autotransporter adhesin